MNFFFRTCLLLVAYQANAQTTNLTPFCGTDELRIKTLQENPQYLNGAKNSHHRLEEFTNTFTQNYQSHRGTLYIIPVVFHIIHNYGIENISDAQVLDAIEVTNRNMRKLNPDTVDIIPAFKSIAADCQIELRLAQKDPNGNCTSGINRIASPLTYIGDHSVKQLIQWDPSKYLNVYVCADAAGIAGHAIFPSDADTIPQWDGIVIRHDYLGSIGTSTPFKSIVLTHELGHYLNLQHIWGGNNVPGYYYLPVAQSGNCYYDDGVADTPNTIGWQTCNLNGASCGNIVDNVQNFMDYAYCPRMFTEGQKIRMHAALNAPVGNRNNLWQPANLAATGTDGNNSLCAAAITANRNVICAGQSITFTDVSYHGITARNWTFIGGNPANANTPNVTVTYNTPGIYAVQLEVTNGIDTLTVIENNYITVLADAQTILPIIESFENTTSLPNAYWMINNFHNDQTFTVTGTTSYTGNKCISIDNYNCTTTAATDELISATYDYSNQPASTTIDFKYAFTFKDTINTTDRLRVFISGDCGQTWVLKKNMTGNVLKTANYTNQPFVPQNQSQWKSTTITGINGSLLSDKFRIKFIFEAGGGNNFYLDDINFGNATYLDEWNEFNESITLSPNPFTDEIFFELNTAYSGILAVIITDINGKVIWSGNYNSPHPGEKQKISLHNLAQGMYYVNLFHQHKSVTRKIIKL
jgi:PKD repeat protein